MKSYILDTHIFISWAEGRYESFSKDQTRILKAASPSHPLQISEISLWEVANLVSLRKISLNRPIRDWLEAAAAPPLVERIGISPAIATEVATLPDFFHRDPADRIIIATARVFGAAILTSDSLIINSKIVPCVS